MRTRPLLRWHDLRCRQQLVELADRSGWRQRHATVHPACSDDSGSIVVGLIQPVAYAIGDGWGRHGRFGADIVVAGGDELAVPDNTCLTVGTGTSGLEAWHVLVGLDHEEDGWYQVQLQDFADDEDFYVSREGAAAAPRK